MAYQGKIHEITPRDSTTPLCGKADGKTRAGRADLRVTCKRCLRLMKSKKIIARRIAARKAQRRQKRQAA